MEGIEKMYENGDVNPERIQQLDNAQENPKLLEILKRNDGDPEAAALEIADKLNDPEYRIAMARLVQKWDELKGIKTIH